MSGPNPERVGDFMRRVREEGPQTITHNGKRYLVTPFVKTLVEGEGGKIEIKEDDGGE